MIKGASRLRTTWLGDAVRRPRRRDRRSSRVSTAISVVMPIGHVDGGAHARLPATPERREARARPPTRPPIELA
jgi:hypothetical protein